MLAVPWNCSPIDARQRSRCPSDGAVGVAPLAYPTIGIGDVSRHVVNLVVEEFLGGNSFDRADVPVSDDNEVGPQALWRDGYSYFEPLEQRFDPSLWVFLQRLHDLDQPGEEQAVSRFVGSEVL